VAAEVLQHLRREMQNHRIIINKEDGVWHAKTSHVPAREGPTFAASDRSGNRGIEKATIGIRMESRA
jgi:hypothetical protein